MRKAIVSVTAVVLLGVAGAACVAIHRIDAHLQTARQQVADLASLPFTLSVLPGAAAPGGPVNPGFEPFTSSSSFTTGAAFEGKLYLAGAGGLAIYTQPDATPKLLRPGLDLPAAPIVALATGRLRGHASPSLFAATHGQGLLLLDREGIQQLRPANAADRDITAVLPLASGDVLLGTRNAGLLLFDGQALRLFQPAFANLPVTTLAGDEGDFWIGTRTRGVLHWHAGELDSFDKAAGLPDLQVEDIAISPAGVFVGTPLGVAQFVNGRIERTLAQGAFAHTLAVQGESLLIGTIDQGLREVSWKPGARPAASLRAASFSGSNPDESIPITHFFRADQALLAVQGSTVLRREAGGGWQRLISSPSENAGDENISALSVSPGGQLWVGYFDHGIAIYPTHDERSAVLRYNNDQLFCINRIVYDDRRHTMNVATANGLVLFDDTRGLPKPKQVLTRHDGLISDQVTDIAFTSSGMVAATPAGVTFFTADGAQSMYAFQGLVNNHVYTLAAEPANARVFAGTLGGISLLQDGAIRQNITLKNSGLKRNWITAITRVPEEGAPDTWFVGTYGGGVVRMDAAARISAMAGALPAAVINPNAMLSTPQHVLAGSLDDGLLVYNKSSRRWSQITAGLPSRNITALVESHGELYIGTDNGIVRIAEARLP